MYGRVVLRDSEAIGPRGVPRRPHHPQRLQLADALALQRAGEVIVQGEDLGAWTRAQRVGWDKLTPVQQWLLDSVLGMESLTPEETAAQPARRTQADRWATHLAAARQFHDREGHLHVGRKHVEEIAGEGGEVVGLRLGGWLDNTRRRADMLTPGRRAALDELGMRW
ncbi:helicase associated domain-containing protein [Streptomyces mirabilis]|uniref:helicase associated domain-containing protein n=1 Tax=Streptomyces mirabilis TaxID=68239 RepID=UPI0033C9CC71